MVHHSNNWNTLTSCDCTICESCVCYNLMDVILSLHQCKAICALRRSSAVFTWRSPPCWIAWWTTERSGTPWRRSTMPRWLPLKQLRKQRRRQLRTLQVLDKVGGSETYRHSKSTRKQLHYFSFYIWDVNSLCVRFEVHLEFDIKLVQLIPHALLCFHCEWHIETLIPVLSFFLFFPLCFPLPSFHLQRVQRSHSQRLAFSARHTAIVPPTWVMDVSILCWDFLVHYSFHSRRHFLLQILLLLLLLTEILLLYFLLTVLLSFCAPLSFTSLILCFSLAMLKHT